MLTVPHDVVKNHLLIYLGKKDRRSLGGTCKSLYSMYTPRARINYRPLINGKRKCEYCNMFVFENRYKSHYTRCFKLYLKSFIYEPWEEVPQKVINQNISSESCDLCDSLHSRPQKNCYHVNIEHPYIKCNVCGKGITGMSKGCLQCKFYCKACF